MNWQFPGEGVCPLEDDEEESDSDIFLNRIGE